MLHKCNEAEVQVKSTFKSKHLYLEYLRNCIIRGVRAGMRMQGVFEAYTADRRMRLYR
jgi:hypothetical protein